MATITVANKETFRNKAIKIDDIAESFDSKADKNNIYTRDEANTELAKKEDAANKKTTITNNDTDFPTTKAVKTELDSKAPINATLTNQAESNTLPATTSTAITSLLQTVRNNLKYLFNRKMDNPQMLGANANLNNILSPGYYFSPNIYLYRIQNTPLNAAQQRSSMALEVILSSEDNGDWAVYIIQRLTSEYGVYERYCFNNTDDDGGDIKEWYDWKKRVEKSDITDFTKLMPLFDGTFNGGAVTTPALPS